MSKRTKNQERYQQYSGPELAPLLDQVMVELGPKATIADVAKVRSGGFAGFFCREQYQIMVDCEGDREPAQSTKGRSATSRPRRAEIDDDQVPNGARRVRTSSGRMANDRFRDLLERRLDEIAEEEAQNQPQLAPRNNDREPEILLHGGEPPAPVVALNDTGPEPDIEDLGAGVATESKSEAEIDLDEVADQSNGEPTTLDLSDRAAEARHFNVAPPELLDPDPDPDLDDSDFDPVPDPDGDDDNDDDGSDSDPDGDDDDSDLHDEPDLETELDDPDDSDLVPGSEPDSHAGLERPPFVLIPPTPARFTLTPPTPATYVTTGALSDVADPPIKSDQQGLDEPLDLLDLRTESLDVASAQPEAHPFWSHREQAQQDLAEALGEDHGSAAVTAMVGPLAVTTALVRRLQHLHRISPEFVTVLTNRTEIVSEPSWRLVRSEHELLEAVKRSEHSPQMIVIDVPSALPVWVGPLLNRLQPMGLGQVRLALDGMPSTDRLAPYQIQIDQPYVVDLVAKASPALVASLFDGGHPIATVGGAEMSPEFLMALREQVRRGSGR